MLVVVTTVQYHSTIPDRGRRLSGKASVLALVRNTGSKRRTTERGDREEPGEARDQGGGGFSRDKKGRKFWAYASKERGSLSERAAISLSLCTLYSLFVPTSVLLNCNYARRRVGIDVSHRIIGNLFCDPYPGDSDPATISTRPAILRETRRKAANDSHFDDT
jgi:hypothetical protein